MANKSSMSGFPDKSVTLTPLAATALDLHGKTFVVVGGTDGLGRAIAKLAASRGAAVTVVGRTFRDEGVSGVSFVKADLSSLRTAAHLGRELAVESADVVLFTAGIMAAKQREATAEGIERDLAISYLNRFVMTRELAPRLGVRRPAGAPPPRVFAMGFPGTGQLGDPDDLNAEKGYDAFKVHMNTVAGNEALVLEGARRWPQVRFFGLNPGLIKTNIRANFLGEGSATHRVAEFFIGLFMTSPERYAERILPVIFAPELDSHNARMFGQKGNPILPTDGMSPEQVARLIGASERLADPVVRG